DSRGLNDSPESSLSPGFQAANMISAGFIAVPVEVTTWLALNRASLPEPPFTMAVTHYVTGVTSSGDRLETNKLTLFVVVTPDVIITPETTNPEVTATPKGTATPKSGDETEANTESEPEAYGS
ncbi:MAG: hypothetical protein GYA55_09365, partial [SAR324 cluster bacterium]|nr:hypothetical protein [SAR324 cluster bacterium]